MRLPFDHYDIAPGLVSKNYPLMKDAAIYFINADANSPEGPGCYCSLVRIAIVYICSLQRGCLIHYKTILLRLYRLLVLSPPVSSVYNDDRYNSSQFAGDQLGVSIKI